MRHYCLPSISPARPDATLEFDWDMLAGSVSGRDAVAVLALCTQALADGSVVGHPYPTFHALSDPLHSLRDMAVVLGQGWRLDAELLAAYPHRNDPDPDAPEGVTLTF